MKSLFFTGRVNVRYKSKFTPNNSTTSYLYHHDFIVTTILIYLPYVRTTQNNNTGCSSFRLLLAQSGNPSYLILSLLVYYSPFSSNVNEFRSFRRSLRELLGAAMARNDSIVEWIS